MPVSGDTIKLSDLTTLAGLANSLTSMAWDLSTFFQVNPLYYDDSSQPWGYWQFGGISINKTSTGYKTGDVLTDSTYGVVVEVEETANNGNIVGIRILSAGQNAPSASTVPTVIQPIGFTYGGSGTGAQYGYATTAQVGPNQNYSFGDYNPTSGYVTDFYLVNSGINYQISESITFATLAGAQLKVNNTGSSGSITSYTVVSLPTVGNIPNNIGNLPASSSLSGANAVFGGYYTLNAKPKWLTELNRMRSNYSNILQVNTSQSIAQVISPKDMDGISGPWPVNGPTNNYDETYYYYASSTPTGSVSITSSTSIVALGQFTTEYVPVTASNWVLYGDGYWGWAGNFYYGPPPPPPNGDPNYAVPSTITWGGYTFDILKDATDDAGYHYYDARPTDYNSGVGTMTDPGLYCKTLTASIYIGGSASLQLSGYLYILGTVTNGETFTSHYDYSSSTWTYTHTLDMVPWTSLVTIGGNMPGTISKYTNIGSMGTQSVIVVDMNHTFSPGRYDITIETDNRGPDGYYFEEEQYGIIDPSSGVPSNDLTRGYSTEIQTTFNRVAWKWPTDSVNASPGGWADNCLTYTTNPFAPTGRLQATVKYSGGEPVNGICGNNNVYRIQIPGDAFGNGPEFGAIQCNTINDWLNPPWPQPTFSPDFYVPANLTFGLVPPNGYWTAKCSAVNNLNTPALTSMPWNFVRTKYFSGNTIQINPILLQDNAPAIGGIPQIANGYDVTLPVESQMEPPLRIVSRFFSQGFNIMGDDGNLYQAVTDGVSSSSVSIPWPTVENGTVSDGGTTWKMTRMLSSSLFWSANTSIVKYNGINDSNNNCQVCSVAGVTGMTEPTWSTAVDAKTTDGTVTWLCRNPITQKQHRDVCVPKYPHYWSSESNYRFMPPIGMLSHSMTTLGNGNQWARNLYPGGYDVGWSQDNYATGWWIYSVSLTKVNRQFDISGSLIGGQVSATLGCIRNGSFTSFGMYSTGQTYNVLWPVFTSDCLVYNCSERVDIQATAIAAGPGGGIGVSSGYTIPNSYPIAAAFVSDTTNLLNLL